MQGIQIDENLPTECPEGSKWNWNPKKNPYNDVCVKIPYRSTREFKQVIQVDGAYSCIKIGYILFQVNCSITFIIKL